MYAKRVLFFLINLLQNFEPETNEQRIQYGLEDLSDNIAIGTTATMKTSTTADDTANNKGKLPRNEKWYSY